MLTCQVFVMEGGKLVQKGSHEELMTLGKQPYTRLYGRA